MLDRSIALARQPTDHTDGHRFHRIPSQLRVGGAWIERCQTSWWRLLDRTVSEGQAGNPPPQRTEHGRLRWVLWSRLPACSWDDELHRPRSSGPPVATQRRAISVVGEQNGEDCDHAARASGGLPPGRDRRTGLPSPWSARYDYVREVPQSRNAREAHCQTCTSRWALVFPRACGDVAAAVTAPDAVADADSCPCHRSLITRPNYSTVTDLARFLGWSTSWLRSTATL